ncbi:MAG: DnaJ C-terminal domain-containing protein [Candidatus Hodarchaeales archaeon]
MKNPHEILGLSEGATENEIKKAYKKLAMEWHPDRHKGSKKAEEKFKEISVAFETLKSNNWMAPQKGFDLNSVLDFNMNDFFSTFGFNIGGDRNQRTQRMKTGSVLVTLEEAYSGCKKRLRVEDETICDSCKGTRYEITGQKCQKCNGFGQVRHGNGAVTILSTCNACKSSGMKLGPPCSKCNGKGKISNIKEIQLVIPPGTAHGSRLSPSKDVQMQVLYKVHDEYTINDNMVDISSHASIDMKTAILGGKINVNTLGGTKVVKIGPGCQPNSVLRIKKAGMRIGNSYGNHLLEINVKLPTNLTKKQNSLFKKFIGSLSGGNVKNNDGEK